MISFKQKKIGLVRRYPIVGGRRLSNYWWSIVMLFGGYGFLLTGISSYYNRDFYLAIPLFNNLVPPGTPNLPVLDSVSHNGLSLRMLADSTTVASNLSFFPQGLVLSFYGFLGLCLSFHLWFTLFWKIGGGFNEFNGKHKYVRVFRWGRPGKNRRIDFKYTNQVIETVQVEIVPRPALFLRLKGEKRIPLTRLGEFIPLEELEAQASELTSLLQVPLQLEN